MTTEATGTIAKQQDGVLDLTVTRVFRGATVEDVWASITESERTERWYGAWRGEPGVGNTIEVRMAFEENADWSPMRIDACDPPHRLRLYASDDYGVWDIELVVRDLADAVALDLIHHGVAPEMAGDIGPGWEFYLDNLVAARNGTTMPVWDDYYPAMCAWFKDQLDTPAE